MTTSHHPPQFFLSLYGWTYWFPIVIFAAVAIPLFLVIPGGWPAAIVVAVLAFACLAFYRDFNRPIPVDAAVMVAPADGKVTEITHLPHYAPFNGPALKVSIFLSVLDVHVNRSPCDGLVLWTRYEEGLFLDARHPDCSEKNQSHTLALGDPAAPLTAPPTAVVKQIVGAIARRIISPVVVGERLTRGQRFGMIAFGSRTELFVPEPASPDPAVPTWQLAVALHAHVKGGQDILLRQQPFVPAQPRSS